MWKWLLWMKNRPYAWLKLTMKLLLKCSKIYTKYAQNLYLSSKQKILIIGPTVHLELVYAWWTLLKELEIRQLPKFFWPWRLYFWKSRQRTKLISNLLSLRKNLVFVNRAIHSRYMTITPMPIFIPSKVRFFSMFTIFAVYPVWKTLWSWFFLGKKANLFFFQNIYFPHF